MSDNYIEIDARAFEELKRLYSDAVKDKKEMFYFQNQALLTAYAKYLIQYLEQKFA